MSVIAAAKSESKPDSSGVDPWDALAEKLAKIGELEDDWDGEGSPAAPRGVMDTARERIGSWRRTGAIPPDHVLLGVNATVFFEWYSPGEYREIEITGSGTFEERVVPNAFPAR